MKIDFSKVQSYGIEGMVILFSVILSFYVEGQRDLAEKNDNKDKLILDLINSIDEDLEQIQNINKTVSSAVQNINDIQSDINSDDFNPKKNELISKAITANVGTSFFPQKGIFNQLISTGSFELIDSQELKSILLRLFNHQNERNIAISTSIDFFNIEYQNNIYSKFRIDTEYNSLDGEYYGKQVLRNFQFDKEFYYSNEFYGLLSRAKQWGNMYIRLLNDIEENYKQARIYAEYEISNK
ncbi:MAG: hypothetical protein CBE27_003035 [Pelagibacteraceae bacterium TMED267]|nr:MAG: hypothetical protein CBE27_003035 [Pelagibacteraceae bacterium TMED267]|tara:strand:- start:284 stop:1003 length:720 start_codon:yes stop_codon:yes gene_type:complete